MIKQDIILKFKLPMKEYLSKFPFWGLFIPRNSLLSKEQNKWLQFLNESESWSEDQLQEYQWRKIKQLIEHCYANVPYYKNMFVNMGAIPQDFKSFSDYERIPLLTKEKIRDNFKQLIAKNYQGRTYSYNTGGSSGNPLEILKSNEDDALESAFMTKQWGRVGFKQFDKRVILRGERLEDGKLWKFRPIENVWIFSSYHLSPATISLYVKKLNKIKPKFIHVYPSSLWAFVTLAIEQGLNINFRPRAILSGSERLLNDQRIRFEKYFNCTVYSWLGLTEQTILAGECEYNNLLHIFPEYSYVELINDENKKVTEINETGQIVGTTLHKYCFPLLRYVSGDIAKFSNTKCICKRNHRLLIGVEGRLNEFLYLKNGSIVPLTALVFGQHLEVFNKIVKLQIEQLNLEEVIVRIIKGIGYNAEDEKNMISKLTKATDNQIKFTCQHVDNIATTQRGKHQFFIQNITANNKL